jgi:hypothetical protein
VAKGALITDRVKILIAKVHREHPKWKAPMVRNEVDYLLHDEKPTGWPSLSTVQKVLAEVRKNEGQPSPEDKPWHMGMLNEYPMSPEEVSAIFRVWKFCVQIGGVPNIVARINLAYEKVMGVKLVPKGYSQKKVALEKLEKQLKRTGNQLSIRDAKWVARLSHVILDTDYLVVTARVYSDMELTYQFVGQPFDSTSLDEGIIEDTDYIPSHFSKEMQNKLKYSQQKLRNEREVQNERPHNQEG